MRLLCAVTAVTLTRLAGCYTRRWSDSSNPDWIKAQTTHMTLRDCPLSGTLATECCGYVFNTGERTRLPSVYMCALSCPFCVCCTLCARLPSARLLAM